MATRGVDIDLAIASVCFSFFASTFCVKALMILYQDLVILDFRIIVWMIVDSAC